MNRTSRLLALSAAAVLGLAGAAGADTTAGEASETTRVFLANDGADCGANDAPFLTTEARTTDKNCGYVGGGLPLGEVGHRTEVLEAGRTFATRPGSPGGVPFTADAGRDLTGVVTVRNGSQQGVSLPGGGQVIADIGTRVRVGKKTYDLGAQTLETTAQPGAVVELPFTVDLPPALQGLQVSAVEFDLDVRGLHMFHGFMVLNGKTYLDLPVVPAEEPAAG